MKKGTLEYYMAQNYPVEIREIPEELGGGYSASIPHLGRWAFFAVGDAIQEALEELEEVKQSLFEDMLERGKSIPPAPAYTEEAEEYSGRLLLRIPRDLHRDLAELAEKNGTSINQYVATILAQYTGGEKWVDVAARSLQLHIQQLAEHNICLPSAVWSEPNLGQQPKPALPELGQCIFSQGYALTS